MRIKGEVKREGQKRLKKRKNRKNQWAFQALPDMRTEPLTCDSPGRDGPRGQGLHG